MLSGRLVSTKLLSRLVLLWYNPTVEEDLQLRHCLFLPVFAFASRYVSCLYIKCKEINKNSRLLVEDYKLSHSVVKTFVSLAICNWFLLS